MYGTNDTGRRYNKIFYDVFELVFPSEIPVFFDDNVTRHLRIQYSQVTPHTSHIQPSPVSLQRLYKPEIYTRPSRTSVIPGIVGF